MSKATPDIRITQEMIEAGRELVHQYDPDFDSASDYAVEIYRAMEKARLNPHNQTIDKEKRGGRE